MTRMITDEERIGLAYIIKARLQYQQIEAKESQEKKAA
jgi:hypothetical protein